MSANFLRMPDDLTERYKATAKVLNAELAQKGLKPIKPTELMRIVMARIVGLPVSHDIEIDAVTEAAKKAPAKQAKKAPAKQAKKAPAKAKKAPAKAKKAPAKQAKKAPAKDTTSNMTTRPHGGKTAAKRTSKKAPATAERWTPPHGG